MSPNVSTARRDKQSFHYIIRSGLAGGIAGCVAKTVVAPLDRVKILFQASNPDYRKYAGSLRGAFCAGVQIYREGGVRGLFQGHSATLLRIFPYAAIKFMAYDQVHHMLMPTRAQETNARRFLAGAISGTMSVCVTYPLDVIRVRMAFQTKSPSQYGISGSPTFTQVLKHIYNEPTQPTPTLRVGSVPVMNTKNLLDRFPILKFYRGFSVTIAGMIPYAGVSFLSWGFLRARFLPPDKAGHRPPTPIADLAIGAVSGLLAQTASYPFEVIRRRMQVGGITRPDRWLRLDETVRAIWQCGGWRGFYVGLAIGYLKIVPMTAVSFAVWQGTKRLLDV
ncbi:putative mitochondrial carrier (TC 2.A.29) family protein [Lyophyllum shimeji]|uniref:Mitochondrial carrier (TC 2.A.29) family protein n=1 Tax=Lyophyllum shimeji TaxID=47721 RepID=A0A9P3ULZ7_LYOSH|nr:putative mitochondrial carrier (TC 2.A.29) family protein [Lyophyllum shimeji]